MQFLVVLYVTVQNCTVFSGILCDCEEVYSCGQCSVEVTPTRQLGVEEEIYGGNSLTGQTQS